MVQIGSFEIEGGLLLILVIVIIGVALLTWGAIECGGLSCLLH